MEEKRSRVQNLAAFMVVLAVTLGGFGSAPAWIAVPGGAMLLLWIADRGQHRRLADKFPGMPRSRVLSLSITGHALLAAVACAGAYALGRLSGWFFAG